ncbi:MAG: hypothetical protein JW782_04325 [Candidatus Saganbacteria bacterium]|nr:hypothetical protein [Candidatus Saganbacteria bacterium]
MKLIIYEDEGYKNFLPLAWTRPVYDLRCGIDTLAQKMLRQYPKAVAAYGCRYYLPGEKLMKFERGLFINGRVLAGSRLAREIPLKGKDEIFFSGEEIVAVRAVSKPFAEVKKRARTKRVNVQLVKYPWDLIVENSGQILADSRYHRNKKQGKAHKSAVFYNHKDIIIAAGAEVEAHAVLDARQGPIYIGPGTIVRAGALLKGPLSIGPGCRIGGEISASIIHGYSNKSHYGFLGHAYIGEWVNLGAGTTNSNLKNTYGNVKVEIDGKSIDSGLRFLGCFIADHAKTGIGTLITTGAAIGVGANIFGGGVTPKVVPCFSWGQKGRYELSKMLASAALIMERRSKKLDEQQKEMLAKIYQFTK